MYLIKNFEAFPFPTVLDKLTDEYILINLLSSDQVNNFMLLFTVVILVLSPLSVLTVISHISYPI